MGGDGDQWSVLVPVKRLDRAKTRLELDPVDRADVALAMAIDTVRAVLATGTVGEAVVITDDDRATAAVIALGARVVADRPDAGLNPALAHGATVATMPRLVALSSDLPALRSDDLGAVLAAAARHRRSVVSDLAGTGTTLLAAGNPAEFVPAFGADSLAAHLRSGAIDLSPLAAASVRHDVDTVGALWSAAELGVGADTTRMLANLGPRSRKLG
jgi:2-phospho-L-lactate guanylyltransferase